MPGFSDKVSVETPEHVVFHYHLAGTPSRILAGFLDLIFQTGIFLLILLAFALFGAVVPSGIDVTFFQEFTGWMIGFLIVVLFLDVWGYPILFELFMDGRTPGKKAMRLRVIRDNGTALTPGAVIVRNICRAVDFLFPAGPLTGILVSMLNTKNKRIGDYAAGTLVIREQLSERMPSRVSSAQLRTLRGGEMEEEAGNAALSLSDDEVKLIEHFLARRSGLTPEARRRLARQIAEPIMKRMGLPVRKPESFLNGLLLSRRRMDREDSR